MKKRILVCIVGILLLSLVACQGGRKSDVEHTIGFYSLFGETVEMVTNNIDFGNAQGVTKGNETIYTFDCENNDEGFVKKELFFYNDVLMAEKTYFADVERAYYFAKQYRKNFAANYGEKDTYPEVHKPNTGFLDDISSVESLQEQWVYYEDYAVTVSDKKTDVPWLSSAKAKNMLGNRQYSRIDMRLELGNDSSESASVSVKYIVLP